MVGRIVAPILMDECSGDDQRCDERAQKREPSSLRSGPGNQSAFILTTDATVSEWNHDLRYLSNGLRIEATDITQRRQDAKAIADCGEP